MPVNNACMSLHNPYFMKSVNSRLVLCPFYLRFKYVVLSFFIFENIKRLLDPKVNDNNKSMMNMNVLCHFVGDEVQLCACSHVYYFFIVVISLSIFIAPCATKSIYSTLNLCFLRPLAVKCHKMALYV